MIAIVVVAGFWVADFVAVGGVGTRVDGQTVWRDVDQIRARFLRTSRLDGEWMIFGGDPGGRKNSLVHATVAGLDVRSARGIASQYPDFHLCKSPGAARAQNLTEAFSYVAANRSARNAMREALRLHGERVAAGGERTCLRVRGSELALQEIRLADGNRDLSGEMLPAFRKTRFVLAEHAEVTDCRALLQ